MRRFMTVVLWAALACVGVAAQVFRVGVDTVYLSVTVANAQGRAVPVLDQASFRVFEDGVVQDVSAFANDPQPIALSLLIDSSTSMESKIAVATEAAIGFARQLHPHDVAQIVDFNNDIQIRQTFTNDRAALERAIRQIRTGGSTSLYTALYVALSELQSTRTHGATAGPLRRQAVIVLSDGEDSSSVLSYEAVLDLAKRSDVAFYAIGLRDKGQPESGEFQNADFVLRSLSQMTGGRAFFVRDVAELGTIYSEIANELANQYLIGYVSKNLKRDGTWRQVAVRVARPETVTRTRAGYFAPSK